MTFVELTPETAQLLLDAYWTEKNRVRHEAEQWEGQAARDATKLRKLRLDAILNHGVPEEQVNRFVYGEEH